MNVKSKLRPQDFHLVLSLNTLKLKLFKSDGTLSWVTDAVRDYTANTRKPEATTGELVLTGSKNPNYINTNPAWEERENICDYAFVWDQYTLPPAELDKAGKFPGILYRIKSDPFNELKLFAQHLPTNVGGKDLRNVIAASTTPVVYFSAG